MQFEYDPNKSASNKVKHGVDFEEAQELWNDPFALEIKTTYVAEERWAVIGIMDNRHWTAIVTHRNEKIRIISVRRSHKNEEVLYDNFDKR